MTSKEYVDEIELKIASHEMTVSQVFTQMRQLINSVVDERNAMKADLISLFIITQGSPDLWDVAGIFYLLSKYK